PRRLHRQAQGPPPDQLVAGRLRARPAVHPPPSGGADRTAPLRRRAAHQGRRRHRGPRPNEPGDHRCLTPRTRTTWTVKSGPTIARSRPKPWIRATAARPRSRPSGSATSSNACPTSCPAANPSGGDRLARRPVVGDVTITIPTLVTQAKAVLELVGDEPMTIHTLDAYEIHDMLKGF